MVSLRLWDSGTREKSDPSGPTGCVSADDTDLQRSHQTMLQTKVQAQERCSVLSQQEQPHVRAIKKAIVLMENEKEADTRTFRMW